MKRKKLLAILLVSVMLVMLVAACGGNAATPATPDAPAPAPAPADPAAPDAPASQGPIDYASVEDSSDLPDWTGPQLNLTVWQGHGTGDASRDVSSDDVVSPEIKRAFGLSFDADTSFDNAGQDITSMIAIMAATRDFPHIGYNVIDSDLIRGDVLYDLTDYIPQYMPNYYAMLTQFGPIQWQNGFNKTGRTYHIAMNTRNTADNMIKMYPELDMQRYSQISPPTDRHGDLSWISVRDDILKLMYPNAKTQAEIEALYVEQGYFTREDVYDVPLRSWDDVVKFFYDMKDVIDEHNITVDGRPVFPLFLNAGQDNWALLSWLNNGMSGMHQWNYFTYFDLKAKDILMGYEQDWFKEQMRVFNQMLRDGVASRSAMIESNEIFSEKLNNGEYAVSYAWLLPDHARIAEAGKDWAFRKVFFDIEQDISTNLVTQDEFWGGDRFSIFKDTVSEEELIQILTWADFMFTDAGMKLICWGPRSAGLWEEVNGVRRFTNKELEDNLVFNVENGANIKYNLGTTRFEYTYPLQWPKMYVGVAGGGIHAPRYVYDLSAVPRSPGGAEIAFSTGLFDPLKKADAVMGIDANIWNFTNVIPAFERFWEVRGTGFEPIMTRVLGAANDAEFERFYQEMIDFAALNGMTPEAYAEAAKYIQDEFPDEWAVYQRGWN